MSSYIPVTIEADGTTSTPIELPQNSGLLFVVLPTALTGASLALYGSTDGTNFSPVFLDGTAVTITFGASQIHTINPRASLGLSHVQFVVDAQVVEHNFEVCVGKVV